MKLTHNKNRYRIRNLQWAICLATIVLLGAFAGCTAKAPTEAAALEKKAAITPDYSDVTVPVNIAPLNFKINEKGSDFVTVIAAADGQRETKKGRVVQIPVERWHSMLEASQGSALTVEIYAKRDGQWVKFEPFKIDVAEPVDAYITYRQLQPSYVSYENMTINQRCLENFDEEVLLSSATLSDEVKGQCINCHAVQAYNRNGCQQLHVRNRLGGTLICHDGIIDKINLKSDSVISNGVYPAWHPTLPIIAYSTNLTHQSFHTASNNKIEVQDKASDLVLYHLSTPDRPGGWVTDISSDTTRWETFPSWSADGKALYYASADAPVLTDSMTISDYESANYREIRYNIYRMPFDEATMSFGASDTIVNAVAEGKSAIFPRESPDGKYLLYTIGGFGTFHIWHPDADLWIMDLETGEQRPLSEVNSEDTESYHSWSSNGRWILFSSRRDDGSYTRLYLAYFDKEGRAHKPFVLPQESPDYNALLLKSYNVPEFLAYPSAYSRQDFVNAIKEEQ